MEIISFFPPDLRTGMGKTQRTSFSEFATSSPKGSTADPITTLRRKILLAESKMRVPSPNHKILNVSAFCGGMLGAWASSSKENFEYICGLGC